MLTMCLKSSLKNFVSDHIFLQKCDKLNIKKIPKCVPICSQ
jgi:hypothetical protein